jgi:hypothetical protein
VNADDARYVLDRLDRSHVSNLAIAAARAWDDWAAAFELCYQPGDGT